jgi:inorganic pyrophosphatase
MCKGVTEKADPKSKFFNQIEDVNQHDMQCINYFLKHYKDGETNKFIDIGETYGKERALQILEKSRL